jgi:hypothetical protein
MTVSVIEHSSTYSKDDYKDAITPKTVFIEFLEFGKVFRNEKIYSKRLKKGKNALTELRDFLMIGNAESGSDSRRTQVINGPLH